MMSEQQQRILGYFIEEAKDHLNTIEQGLLNLQATIEDPEMVNEVFRAAHSVKGGAAMLDINSVQRTAHRLEDFFKQLKETPVQTDRTLESMFLQIFDGLQSLIEELQGPFGLTDDKAQEVMTSLEPLFAQLENHLNTLVAQKPSQPAAPVAPQPAAATQPPARSKPHSEDSALKLVFRSDVPGHLRDMLNLFKQADTPDSRAALQACCDELLRIGEQFDLNAWCTLTKAARRAISNQEQTYRTLARVLIKDLKHSQEMVLANQEGAIAISENLQSLLPEPLEAEAANEEELDNWLDEALSAPEEEPDFSGLFDEDSAKVTAAEESLDADWLTAETSTSSSEATVDTAASWDDFSLEPVESSDSGDSSQQPHRGPEVGAAELNSLADLFEGEMGAIDSPWQEAEPAEAPSAGDRDALDIDISGDFSDLLLAEDDDADDGSELATEQELSGLFGDATFNEEALDLGTDAESHTEAGVEAVESDATDGSEADFSDLLEFSDEALSSDEPASLDDALELDQDHKGTLGESNELDFAELGGESEDILDLDLSDLGNHDAADADSAPTDRLDSAEAGTSPSQSSSAADTEADTDTDLDDLLAGTPADGLTAAEESSTGADEEIDDFFAQAATPETPQADGAFDDLGDLFDAGEETLAAAAGSAEADWELDWSSPSAPETGSFAEDSEEDVAASLDAIGEDENQSDSFPELDWEDLSPEMADESVPINGDEDITGDVWDSLEGANLETSTASTEREPLSDFGPVVDPWSEADASEVSSSDESAALDALDDLWNVPDEAAADSEVHAGEPESVVDLPGDLSEDEAVFDEFADLADLDLDEPSDELSTASSEASADDLTAAAAPSEAEDAWSGLDAFMDAEETEDTQGADDLDDFLAAADVNTDAAEDADDFDGLFGAVDTEANVAEGTSDSDASQLEADSSNADSKAFDELFTAAEADIDGGEELGDWLEQSEAPSAEDADDFGDLFGATEADAETASDQPSELSEDWFADEAAATADEVTPSDDDWSGLDALMDSEEAGDTEDAGDLDDFLAAAATDDSEGSSDLDDLFGAADVEADAETAGISSEADSMAETSEVGDDLFTAADADIDAGEAAGGWPEQTETSSDEDAGGFDDLFAAADTDADTADAVMADHSLGEDADTTDQGTGWGSLDDIDLSFDETISTGAEADADWDLSFVEATDTDLEPSGDEAIASTPTQASGGGGQFSEVTDLSLDDADLGADEVAATEEDADFSDLDGLLADEQPDQGSAETADIDTDDLGDLDALLEEPKEPSAGVTAAESSPADIPPGEDDFEDLDALLSDEDTSAEATSDSGVDASTGSEFDDLEKLLEEADQTLGGSSPTIRSTSASSNRSARRVGGMVDQTMRVSVRHLDTLSNLVGELVVNRNSLEQDQERLRQFLDNLLFQVQQLNDVGQRMRDLYERSLLESSLMSNRQSLQTPSASSSGSQENGGNSHATGASFDALEMDRFTGFHTLSQEMIELIVRVRESASDIGYTVESSDQITRQFRQVTTQLQEGLNKARMVPFAQTADRLPRAVRDISLKCGKEARLAVEGRDTLIDKMILERLYDPMTHLVNNAITHGVESPEERVAAGKSREGTITVRAFYQGNQTVIYIADDGAGINPEMVKQKAIKKGLITQSEARSMSVLEIYELLFRPGFSTRDQADDFAGRGVGMDVVRTALAEIRGNITIDSEPGRGTSFTIRLPLTLSISKALSCLNNQARIAFPMDGVEDMFDIPKDRVQVDENEQMTVSWRDTTLPLQPLSDLLQFNRTLGRGRVYGGSQDEDMISVVVLRSANTHIGLQVDRVLGEQEIVIKQLEGPIPKPLGIAGATVLGDGRVMPIADVLELIDLAQGRVRRESGPSLWLQPEEPVEEESTTSVKAEPTVLIVDDSITVRELLSMSFNKVGYRVEQARDGQEAWEKLRSGLPCDLVFCDIEMPRMDGLELLSRMQKDTSLSQVPIAMLTSRGADRHRQMALELGASGYFTKPYLEEALLDAANRMLHGEVMLQSEEA